MNIIVIIKNWGKRDLIGIKERKRVINCSLRCLVGLKEGLGRGGSMVKVQQVTDENWFPCNGNGTGNIANPIYFDTDGGVHSHCKFVCEIVCEFCESSWVL